eukprot:5336253-Pleurochrysis_carterae.AAC.1
MRKHNALADFTAALVRAAHSAGASWMVENPAVCGDPTGVAWWPRFAEHAPLWLYPPMRSALDAADAESVTFAQCALGAEARKYTTVAMSADLAHHVGELRRAVCTHGTEGHAAVAHGRDAHGRARATAAA